MRPTATGAMHLRWAVRYEIGHSNFGFVTRGSLFDDSAGLLQRTFGHLAGCLRVCDNGTSLAFHNRYGGGVELPSRAPIEADTAGLNVRKKNHGSEKQ
ncbi:MAG: hypothetical protein ACI8W3_001695 [Myxococcota bacterium]|jgi:hypothetical protein